MLVSMIFTLSILKMRAKQDPLGALQNQLVEVNSQQNAEISTIYACNTVTYCNTLIPITVRDHPFKEHEHEKATGLGPRHLHQPAFDGC